MLEFVENFFAVGPLITPGDFHFWNSGLVGLNMASDSLITLAYYSIPVTLFSFVKKRGNLRFNWIFILLGTLLVFCGATHLIEV